MVWAAVLVAVLFAAEGAGEDNGKPLYITTSISAHNDRLIL